MGFKTAKLNLKYILFRQLTVSSLNLAANCLPYSKCLPVSNPKQLDVLQPVDECRPSLSSLHGLIGNKIDPFFQDSPFDFRCRHALTSLPFT